jgi:RNA polymerase sigma-70 factor (ECF subfamily)
LNEVAARGPEVDEHGLQQLSARFRLPLRRFFERRLRNSPDPDDLVQEVFVRLVRQGTMSAIQHLDGYVFQVAANVLRDHARRWAVRAEEANHAQLEDIEIEGGFSPERVLLGEEALQRMVAALHELPEKTQAIFALYHIESVSQVEIARRLNLSVSTIEKHMGRANAHLLGRLGPMP